MKKTFLSSLLTILLAVLGSSDLAAAATKFKLTVLANPKDLGTTNPSDENEYDEGTSVSVTASPKSGYRFVSWTGEDWEECESGSVVMSKNKECTANFAGYLLSAIPNPPNAGTVTLDPDSASYPNGYPSGQNVSLSIAHDPSKWTFKYWSGEHHEDCRRAVANPPTPVQMSDDDVFCLAVFSRVEPDPPQNEHWMKDLSDKIGDRRLMDVVIPGSHDAGTYSIDLLMKFVFADNWGYFNFLSDFSPRLKFLGIAIAYLVAPWSATQSRTIQEQLEEGIRYFDLRFALPDVGQSLIYHGMTRSGWEDRDSVLNQVKSFLDTNNQEIVILDLTMWVRMNDAEHQNFVDAILDRFEEKMIPEAFMNKTLIELWNDGLQLVVKYEKFPFGTRDHTLFWTDNKPGVNETVPVLCRPWADSYLRDRVKYRFFDYMETGCCYASGCPDQLDCPCKTEDQILGPGIRDKLFALPGLVTPDEFLTICGTVMKISDMLPGTGIFCLIFRPVCDFVKDKLNDFCPGLKIDDPIPRDLFDLVMRDPDDALPGGYLDVPGWISEAWENCTKDHHPSIREHLNIVHVDFVQYANDHSVHGDIVDEAIKINRGDYNLEPTLNTPTVSPTGQLYEGTRVHVTSTVGNLEYCDYHSISVDWGDGISDFKPLDEDQFTASHVYADNGIYTINICVRDGVEPRPDGYVYFYSADCKSTQIEVLNVPPTVDAGLDQVVYEGDIVVLDPARFNDKGTLDTHTATINWGDGSTEEGLVSENPFGPPGDTDGADGEVSGSHKYDVPPGRYVIEICVTDDDGGRTCDQLNVVVVHGFMRFCAYAEEYKAFLRGYNGKVSVRQDAVVECPETRSGIPGATTPSGIAARKNVNIQQATALNGIVMSLKHNVTLGKKSFVSEPVTAWEEVKLLQQAIANSHVRAGAKIKVGPLAVIGGDATSGGEVEANSRAVIHGAVTEHLPGEVDMPKITHVDFTINPGRESHIVQKDETLALEPGSYRRVRVEEGGTLVLKAGNSASYATFVFGVLHLAKNTRLEVEGSAKVLVDVAKMLDFKDHVEFAGVAENMLFRVSKGDITLGQYGSYLGTFIAIHGNVKLEEEATLTGALYGGPSVDLKQNTTVSGQPALDLFIEVFL